MIRRRPGPAPSTAPKRTVRLVLQVTEAEYQHLLERASAGGYSSYADVLREGIGLALVHPRTPPTGPGTPPGPGDTDR